MRKETENKIYTLDCETQPFDGITEKYYPYVFGIFDGENFSHFEDIFLCVEFIRQNKGIYYAHNGGKFDWFFFVKYIEEGKLLFINGRLSSAKIGESELRDSYNLLPVPLRAYKKDDFDYSLLKDYQKNKTVIIEYLKNDCVYLFELVKEFITTYGLSLTIAGSAYKKWKQIYNHSEITDKNYDSTFRNFYFGGRCQSFANGLVKKDMKCYDINSAYPYAMLFQHPKGSKYFTTKSENTIKPYSFVKLICVSKGALPFRDKNGLNFPDDKIAREYFITGHEFLAAKKHGLISGIEILRVYTHLETQSFSKYVDYFYNIKQTAAKNSAQYIISKLFLNSLYGKFGQNYEDFQDFYLADIKEKGIEFEDGKNHYFLSEKVSETKGIYQAPVLRGNFFNVAVSASITGFVRAYLLEHIITADNPYYCDTDSIICDNLPCKETAELGDWKLEGEFSEGVFLGKKLYFLAGTKENKFASKGVKMNKSDYYKILKEGVFEYSPIAPTFSLKKQTQKYVKRRVKNTNNT